MNTPAPKTSPDAAPGNLMAAALDVPAPADPPEVPAWAPDNTLARTGNTARDQEMYDAGIEVGEADTKHNAAIRAAAPGASTVGDAPAAYLTLDEEGSPCMLFFDVAEARGYCALGEEPEALYRRPAPAAGDALDAARWRWILSHAENVGFDYRSGRFTTLTVSGRQGDSLVAFVDAAIAAQQGESGAN